LLTISPETLAFAGARRGAAAADLSDFALQNFVAVPQYETFAHRSVF
jgi:hypothetical protein